MNKITSTIENTNLIKESIRKRDESELSILEGDIYFSEYVHDEFASLYNRIIERRNKINEIKYEMQDLLIELKGFVNFVTLDESVPTHN